MGIFRIKVCGVALAAMAAKDFTQVSLTKAATVKELCEAEGVPYTTGCGYYKLARKETWL